MNGYFENGRPYLDIEVVSLTSQVIKAQIDTGFDGYLMLPIEQAFPMGLILIGTGVHTIANGSQSTSLVCLGTIRVAGIEIQSSINVGEGNSILLGMRLLEKLGNKLEINFKNQTVSII